MTARIVRDVNGLTEFVGRGKRGWQFTNDEPSAVGFAGTAEAKAATLDIIRQVLGGLRIVSDSGEVLDVRLVFTESKS